MLNWYKSAFVDATVLFELAYMQICTVMSSGSYTGFESKLLISQVRLRTPWATVQTYRLWKPIDMKLDMCDANVQKHQFSNLPAYKIFFEVITWYSSSNCANITLFKLKLYIYVKRNKRRLSFTASSVNLFWKLQWYIRYLFRVSLKSAHRYINAMRPGSKIEVFQLL